MSVRRVRFQCEESFQFIFSLFSVCFQSVPLPRSHPLVLAARVDGIDKRLELVVPAGFRWGERRYGGGNITEMTFLIRA